MAFSLKNGWLPLWLVGGTLREKSTLQTWGPSMRTSLEGNRLCRTDHNGVGRNFRTHSVSPSQIGWGGIRRTEKSKLPLFSLCAHLIQ